MRLIVAAQALGELYQSPCYNELLHFPVNLLAHRQLA